MKLQVRRLNPLRRLAARECLWLSAALSFVVLVELLGRGSASDLEDGLLLGALAGCVVAVAMAHTRSPLPWVRAATTRVRAGVARVRGLLFEIGIDLRGTPSVRPGKPGLLVGVVQFLGITAVALTALAVVGVGDLRGGVTRIFYVGYLIGLGALWVALVTALFALSFLPIAWIHDACVARHPGGPRSFRGEMLAILAYGVAVIAGGLLLPLWVPVVCCSLSFAAVLALVWSSGPDLPLLWRQKGTDSVRVVHWRTYLTLGVAVSLLSWFDLVLVSVGRPALGLSEVAHAMPITAWLGGVVAWLGGAGLTTGSIVLVRWLARQRRNDPARSCPTVVHLGGSTVERSTAESLLRARGFTVRGAAEPPDEEDVRLEILDGAMPPLTGPRRWPLRVSVKALRAPELLDLIARRDEVQRRRRLMRGFERLFRRLVARSFRRGSGFWIAPHYWFVYGASRDTEEDELDLEEGPLLAEWIGPPYHALFPRSARQYLHTVLHALQVDLIFVEDGVGYRRFRSVMRALFEHFDVHGGSLRIEERHLTGLVGTRVMIHDYELGGSLGRAGYPEPDYEDIGRARVLHVFIDRGDSEVVDDTPMDTEDLPVPSPVLVS